MIDQEGHIQRESDRFGLVLARTDPGSRVPSCPQWTALDLLKHLIGVHRFWAAVIGDRLSEQAVEQFEQSRPALPDDPVELLQLRRQATADLLAALAGRDPSEPAWSWFPSDQTVGFTRRMQTHEATIHRVDAELTAGLPISDIGTEVAADGVDHVVDVMRAWAPADAQREVTATVRLTATDADRSWLLQTIRWSGEAWGHTFTDQIGCQRAEAGEAAATVSGTARDLYLLLWNRADAGISRTGQGRALDEFQAMLDDGIP